MKDVLCLNVAHAPLSREPVTPMVIPPAPPVSVTCGGAASGTESQEMGQVSNLGNSHAREQ